MFNKLDEESKEALRRTRMSDKIKKEIFNGVGENVKALAQLFPSVVKDGEVDFSALKQELGEFVEVGVEKYDFTWAGKAKAKAESVSDILGRTLKYKKGAGVDEDTTQNLYIEGDNLEALKLLRNSYYNKIKMIYIDPPYNTGNDDLPYKDNFYKKQSEIDAAEGIVGDDGIVFVKNKKDSSKYHTDWLNLIFPRLKMSKELLTDDGVIFISIDDNEYSHMKEMCDEIFGAENYIETFFIQVRYSEKSLNEKDNFQKIIEQVIIYAKNKAAFIPRNPFEEYDLTKFCYKISEKEEGCLKVLGGKNVIIYKPGQYEIEEVPFSINALKETWASGSVLKGNTSGKFFDKFLSTRIEEDGYGCLYKVDGIGEDGIGYRYFTGPKRLGATKGKFYTGVPLIRREELAFGSSKKYKPITNFYDYSADFGNISNEGHVVFRGGKKPVKMLKSFIDIANLKNGDRALDFFSGSGSFAQAVLEKNVEDTKNNINFILIQIPEKFKSDSDYHRAGFDDICQLAEKRIKNVVDELKNQDQYVLEDNLDIGFKVFKVADTNIRMFSNELNNVELLNRVYNNDDPELFDFNIGATDLDVCYELLLRHRGIPLSSKVDKLSIGERTYMIADSIVVCLDKQVAESLIEQLAAIDPLPNKYIFRDSSFGDDISLKENTMIYLQAIIEKNSGASKKAYIVEFI